MKKRVLTIVLCIAMVVCAVLATVIITAASGFRYGDVNGDGTVNACDLIIIRQYLANYDYSKQEATFAIGDAADVNGDGKINTVDIIELREYIVNADENFADIYDNNGVASVLGVNGLEYTATGYSAVEDGNFVINTGHEIVFEDGIFAKEFNRLSFNYESTAPVQVFITYTLNGEEKTDYFFLEAGKSSFRGLIEGYIDGKVGVSLKKITVNTCEHIDALFVLRGLETEQIPVYEDDLTVENDRYKIGVRLSWGGAMTYFEDKMDGDDELANLVNIHDTGRLIQQSFYGTFTNNDTDSLYGEGYVSVPNGGEGATLWPYNPVQGGDRKNNGSDRLIDVEYDEEKDYIYIVSQSLDWAYVKGNTYETIYDGLTYTYYENTYTIKEGNDEGVADDYVLVDNVMTDFSGWTHGAGGQEIPAVYLVSYFDTLSFYNGVNPWTGDMDNVFYEAELEGWSNSKSFPLYKGNTETWSIWLNTTETGEGEQDFGFGTYCPNIQKHIAIRHQYNGSKDPMANSTSYVAPSCSIVMQSYKPIEYSYILATGSFDQIREVFTENKDFTTNPDLSDNRYDQLLTYGKFDMMNMDFTVESNTDIFFAQKHLEVTYDKEQEAAKMTILNGNDPHASMNFDWNSDRVINSDDFNTVEITYMLPETNSKSGYTLVIFFSAGDVSSYKETNTVTGTLVRDGEYHTLKIRVPESKCQGDLHNIRFDPFPSAAVGDIMYIKNISFTTLEYPDLGADADMTLAGSDNLPTVKTFSDVYMDETENALALKVMGGTDVSITLDYSHLYLSTMVYTGLKIEYMIPKTNSSTKPLSSIYFATTDNNSFSGTCKVGSEYLTVDGEYHTMTFDFTEKAEYWTGDITKLRFDFFENTPAEGDVIYIKRITFVMADGVEIDLSADNPFASTNLTDVYKENGVLVLENQADGSDVNAILNLASKAYSTGEYSKLVIRYMMPTENKLSSYSSTVYFTTSESSGYSEIKSVYCLLTKDGIYHYAIYDLSSKSDTWMGDIAKLRWDYFQNSEIAEGDKIYIEAIYLLK